MITKELLFSYLLAQSKQSEFRIIIVTVTQRMKITSFLITDLPTSQGAWHTVCVQYLTLGRINQINEAFSIQIYT